LSELARILKESIAHDGPMALDTFMAVCLSHSRHGYYMTRDPFGVKGDFVTAPEISQMFGELLGLWAAETWMTLGAPENIKLIELGPGRGTLMADALRAARISNEFASSLEVHLIETSLVLREMQERALAQSTVPVTWHKSLDDVPEGPAIIIANEFFDCLPVRHYVKASGQWHQRLVGLNAQGELSFGLAPDAEALLTMEAPDGSVLEISPASQLMMTQLASRIAKGPSAALIIDYGHGETGYGETLQALKAHKSVSPLDCPGEADLTAHVDFAALTRAAQAAGADVFGPVTQGELLMRLGIAQRADALKKRASEEQAQAIDLALARLVTERVGSAPGMGKLFKAIAIVPRGTSAPAGFRREG
jgi:SAM-dependent MidA family methyltransferase